MAKAGGLSNKQRAFIENYLITWNASEAARRAGYSKKGAHVTGSQLLSNPSISEAIKARLSDLQMSADEVRVRLTDHARGDMSDFLHVGSTSIDIEKADKAGKLHLLKSFTHTVGEKTDTVKVELYDAQAALVQLGKMHALFVERTEITGKDGEALTIKVVYGDDGTGNTPS